MTLQEQEVGALLDQPHHDGSDLYVLERPARLGDEAVVRLRVPRAATADRVVLRYERDGEPRNAEAFVDEETETDVWWRASFPVANPISRYRFLLAGGDVGYAWVNALGTTAHEVADADDFAIAVGDWGPAWHLESVVYEIFPDRFASSGAAGRRGPTGRSPASWDELPTGRGPADAVRALRRRPAGDRAAPRPHRVARREPDLPDAVLPGELLAPLRRDHLRARRSAARRRRRAAVARAAAHARGIRIVGDLTLNHTGHRHEWFLAAQASPDAPERAFYYFDDSLPHGYESWLGHPTLPKLDWRSDELHERFGAVLRRYLELGLDGWRIDVANMVGRYRDLDLNREVSKWAREQIGDGLLIAEHGHDFRPDLGARGWHGVMNYSGFLRPLWTWLIRDDPDPEQQEQFWGIPVGVPSLDGEPSVAALRRFRAGVPWESVIHSWNLLDSHDTARFRTIAGTRERHLVGVGLQMTLPGVPMLFAGDELGLEGAWGEDARRTMPWDAEETLGHGRSSSRCARSPRCAARASALARGGIRYVHVSADAIAFLRETRGEQLLVLASRAAHEPITTPFRSLETLYGDDALERRPARRRPRIPHLEDCDNG